MFFGYLKNCLLMTSCLLKSLTLLQRLHWKLPRKGRIVAGFFHPHRGSLVVAGWFPSCAVVPPDRAIGIRIPSDHEVFWFCLDSRIANAVRPRNQPAPIFQELRVSDK